MPNTLPSESLCSQLAELGLQRHERRALRSLVHEHTGAPPPDGCSADELARMVLTIAREKKIDLKPRDD